MGKITGYVVAEDRKAEGGRPGRGGGSHKNLSVNKCNATIERERSWRARCP